MEIAFSQNQCIKCGSCGSVCPTDAIDLNLPGRIQREKCDRCGKCADVCPGKGLRRVGEYFTVESLAEILLRDVTYYRSSGGGVTLSGGECTMFPSYLESLLKLLREQEIQVVLETSGYFNYFTFCKKILPYLDLIYYDIKFADDRVHRKFTGRSNLRILENLRRLVRNSRVKVVARIPLVPGITATEVNLSSLIRCLRASGVEHLLPLPYNPMGIDKYLSLGISAPALPYRFMNRLEEEKVREILRAGCTAIARKSDSGEM
jgi:pyruvate formate lyase activating enzyme